MKPVLLCAVMLMLLTVVVQADPGHFEVSAVQSTFVGKPFVGTLGSVRLLCVKAPQPIGLLDVFADGGVRLSETTENSLVGGLFGASFGKRDVALRVGGGYQMPGGWMIYTRACVVRW